MLEKSQNYQPFVENGIQTSKNAPMELPDSTILKITIVKPVVVSE